MSFSYDQESVYPFPSLPITVHQLDGDLSSASLSALLDTGADITLIPSNQLQHIQSDEIYAAQLRMHWGAPQDVSIHLVDLKVGGFHLPGIEVVADNYSNQAILGRNVLNKLIILLDGIGQQTDILERRPVRF